MSGFPIFSAKEAHALHHPSRILLSSQREGTYMKDAGGNITVCSELGESIHKANNRALMLPAAQSP